MQAKLIDFGWSNYLNRKNMKRTTICGPQQGTVVAVGPGTKDNAMTLKVGDNVIYGKYAGTEFHIDGKDYMIMRENDVIAII